MLVDQNRIAIRVKKEKTGRSSPILCFLFKGNTGFFELFLHGADVSKRSLRRIQKLTVIEVYYRESVGASLYGVEGLCNTRSEKFLSEYAPARQ
jgi:hypothetical protein